MAVEYIDGAEYLSETTCGVGPGGWTEIGGGGPQIPTGAGARSGTHYYAMTNNAYMWKGGLTPLATRWVGYGIYLGSPTPSNRVHFAFSDDAGANPNGIPAKTQIGVSVNAARFVEIYRGRETGANVGGTLLGTSSSPITHSQWWWLDVGLTVHGASGLVEVWIDGVQKLALTAQNTQNTANATTNGCIWRGTSDGSGTSHDDIHIGTSRFGPHKIIGRVPALGNGTRTQFAPLTGTDRGDMSNDPTPDGAATYNYSSTVGERVTHHMDALGVTGLVTAVKIRGWIAKSDVGARQWAPVWHRGGVDQDGAGQVLSTSYGLYSQLYETDPHTPAVAATIANIDASEFGSKVHA